MPLTTSTGANCIREAYSPKWEEGVFRNDTLLGLFPPWKQAVGDTSYRWKINSSGNDSIAVFTEGQAQPDAGHQTFTNCAVAWLYIRGMMQITGHARDALGSNWIDAEAEEGLLLIEDLQDLLTTSLMGSTYGLELAVDYGSAYAGITRNGAAGYFESTENGSISTLAYADLVDLQETVRNADKGGLKTRQGAWICNLNQETNIYALSETGKTTNVNTPGRFAENIADQYACGYPIISLPDFTTTVILLLDMAPGNFEKIQIRPFSVKEMGASGDSDVYQLSFGGQLITRNPRKHGKMTGVTA